VAIRAPDLVLREVVQRQVGQPGVLRAPNAVLAAGPATVPKFEVRELPAGGVGDERGDAQPVDVGVRSCAAAGLSPINYETTALTRDAA
jgi:hypothetical protein